MTDFSDVFPLFENVDVLDVIEASIRGRKSGTNKMNLYDRGNPSEPEQLIIVY